MNNCWEDISPCLVRKPDTCIPTIQTRVTHAKCPTLDLDSMGLAPCRTSLQPILQGNKVLWQNFGHNLALKGCETNNTDKVSLVTDASEQSEGSQEKQTAPLQHQGTTTRVFFHRDRWTFINPSPKTTNAPQPAWILLREDYISNPEIFSIFLLNLFFHLQTTEILLQVSALMFPKQQRELILLRFFILLKP